MNDADIEMIQLAEQGDMIANGVCPICEEILDPRNPKWTPDNFIKRRLPDGTYVPMDREEYAKDLGPVDGGYHKRCLDSIEDYSLMRR